MTFRESFAGGQFTSQREPFLLLPSTRCRVEHAASMGCMEIPRVLPFHVCCALDPAFPMIFDMSGIAPLLALSASQLDT